MESFEWTYFWFGITVLPLILTPGPDILLVLSQGLAFDRKDVFKAVNGISLGYAVHALLTVIGIAALVNASPFLFNMLKFAGVIYLIYLAYGMLKAACSKTENEISRDARKLTLWRGFLTSFLNPKGLLVFLSVLPQYVKVDGAPPGQQMVILSLIFIVLCYAVYLSLGLLACVMTKQKAASPSKSSSRSIRRFRVLNFIGGLLLGLAAMRMAAG